MAEVPFLYTINLPSGEIRDGELERDDLHISSLTAKQFPPVPKDEGYGEHVKVHYCEERQMVQLPPWSPEGKRPGDC